MTRADPSRVRNLMVRWPVQRLCLAVCLATFGLYLWQLDSRPLWWDEGVSIYTALLPPAQLLRAVVGDVHVPGYFLLLHGWGYSVGWSPFLTRCVSVVAGVLAVTSLYPLGRRVAGSRANKMPLGAMLLAAILPVGLYLAREVRMYSWVWLLGVWSWYALLRAVALPQTAARWIVYVLVTALALYVHYVFLFVLASQVAYVALTGRGWRNILRQWTLQGMTVLALLCWMIYAAASLPRQVSGHLALGGSAVGPVTFLARYVSYAATGFTLEMTWTTVAATVAWSILVLVGLAVAARRRTPGDWCLLAWVIVPALGMWALGLWYRYEGELTRPLLALTAPALMMTASVLPSYPFWRLARMAAAVVMGGLVVLTVPTLVRYYATISDPAEDYRPLIAQMRAVARPTDAALTAYTWQDGYLASYAPDLHLALYRNVYKARTAPRLLEEIFTTHNRLWVVNYLADVHDTLSPLNIWLNRNAALAFDEWYGSTQLALFVRAGDPPATWPAHTSFEHGIALDYAPLTVSVRPGDVLYLDLRWQATRPLDRSYKVFVHLRQPTDQPVAQSDSEPVGGFEPTDAWRPGQPVLDRRALLVPLDASPGAYGVYVGIYDPDSSIRLRIASPSGCDTLDSVCVGHVEIASPGTSSAHP